MSKRILIYIIIGWCILTIIEYYFIPYFVVFLLWILLSIAFLGIAIIQIMKLVREWGSLTKLRIAKVLVFSILFYLTFNQSPVNRLIEKADWSILYDRRSDIIEKVKRHELNPNGSFNNGVCKLPYEFPVVSNGGNDIIIGRKMDSEKLTVTFWVFRNFFEAPSTCFVYTTDEMKIDEFEKLISRDPDNNWKIEENWYRTFRE
jgi:hypothetical protein